MKKAVRPAVMSKQYGHEDFLADLISKACISILPEKSSFNVDNVRVTKILGSGLLASSVVQVWPQKVSRFNKFIEGVPCPRRLGFDDLDSGCSTTLLGQ